MLGGVLGMHCADHMKYLTLFSHTRLFELLAQATVCYMFIQLTKDLGKKTPFWLSSPILKSRV